MSQTAPVSITALPAAPSTTVPSTFATLADAFVAALATLQSQTNSVSTVNYNNAVDCYTNAVAALASQVAAAASAAAANSIAGAVAWAAGTYALNAAAISQIDFQTYRKITASSVTSIDPKNDKTNWVLLGAATSPAAAYYSQQNFGGF